MSESLGDAVLHLRTDDSALDTGMRTARGKAEALASDFNRVGSKMQGLGARLSLGLTTPLVAMAATSAQAATESRQALAQVESALVSMGPKAGKTSDELQELAGRLQDISLFDDDDIMKSVTANMLTFGNVSGQAFERAQLAAVNLSARLGQDLQSSALQVGKALNDPVKGVTALQRVGVSFTEQQRAQIKAMAEAGDMAGAQAIILGELEKQFGGAAKAQRAATPDAGMQQQWRTFQETTGALVNSVLPILTGLLERILSGFNQLSPGVQTTIVGVLGLSAALGPSLIGIGTMVTGLGRLLPLLTGLGPVLLAAGSGIARLAPLVATLGRALLALALNPVFLTIAALVAGVYLAWQNWDKIAPIISAVGDAISGWWTGTVQPVLDSVGAAIKNVIGIFADYFGGQLKTLVAGVSALLRGDFAGAWEAAKTFVLAPLRLIGRALDTFVPNAVATVAKLYTGIKTWLQDRLGSVIKWVIDKIQSVGDKFAWLLKDTVGNSTVVDLVDGIGLHFGRLKDEMVKPANEAADAVSDAFGGIKGPSFDSGLPESGTGNLPPPTQSSGEGGDTGGDGEVPLPDGAQNDMREKFKQTFTDGIRAALNGDLGGFISDFFDRMLSGMFDKVLSDAADALSGLLFGGGGGGGTGGGLLGSALSSVFSGGFATGGLIPSGTFGIVGEEGPEPVISTPRGALVRPTASLGRGSLQASPPTVSIPISIDATGADTAAIGRVQSQLDRMQAELPSTIVRAVQDAGDRRIISAGGWR